MEVKEYKDGIYRGDYGITYFVLNEKILMKHLGTMYKTTKHFIFGEWAYPLTDDMEMEFNNIYKKVNKW
jgi:hypothetical protein